MTIELVDGKAGTNHISSEDKSIIHQAKFGRGSMVFDWGDALKCTMKTANQAVIGTGCASIQGLDWHITDPETVTIDTGSQGMNRNDIVAAHYHRDSAKNDIETIGLKVLKGTPTSGTATDPTIPTGVILNGATDAYQALWRIPLTGITVGTPVRLFTPKAALWDSVTLYQDSNWIIMRNGRMILIKFSGKIGSGSWDAVECPVKLASWYRPIVDLSTVCLVSNGQTARSLTARADGTIRVANMGNVGSNQDCTGTLCFPIP